MGCMPESGGCERHRTEPFVNYFNQAFNWNFIHRACLDRLYRDSKQPEALYSDARHGVDLVIERKSIVWPRDYAARHSNDHLIADTLLQELSEIAAGQPLSILLSSAPRVPPNESRRLAREIANAIRTERAAVVAGHTIGSSVAGMPWRCFLDRDDRQAADEPETGLIVRWRQSEAPVSPNDLPQALAHDIRKFLESAAEKFRNYPDAHTILLLDPYGAIRYSGEWWWARVFEAVPVPLEVAEVWLATHDWITDVEQGWIFERLHLRNSPKGSR